MVGKHEDSDPFIYSVTDWYSDWETAMMFYCAAFMTSVLFTCIAAFIKNGILKRMERQREEDGTATPHLWHPESVEDDEDEQLMT